MTEAKKEPGAYTRLTEKEWVKAEALYETGEMTQEEIAKKFNVHVATVRRRFSKNGIKAGSKAAAIKEKVNDQLGKERAAEIGLLLGRIRETKEEHYKMASGLAKLTWAEVLKAKQDGSPVSVAMNNLKALDTAMSVLKKAREERYAVLGLNGDEGDDDDLLPQLVVQELTEEQVEELRNGQDDDLDDLPPEDEVALELPEGD